MVISSNSLVEWLGVQNKLTPKNSKDKPWGFYFFKKGLICRGADIRWEICASKWIGLAYTWEANKKNCVTVSLLLCFISYLRGISKKPPGAYIWKGYDGEGGFALQAC